MRRALAFRSAPPTYLAALLPRPRSLVGCGRYGGPSLGCSVPWASRRLLVVVRCEQESARVISAFRHPEGPGLMEQVNIRIGWVVFDHADYDAKNDVLYLHVGEPQEAEGKETPEGHVLRF